MSNVSNAQWQARKQAAIAAHLGLEPDRIVVTNGADDALERSVRSVCAPGRRALLCRPSYGMIRRFALLAGAEVIEVPWWTGDLPVDEVKLWYQRVSLCVAVPRSEGFGLTPLKKWF